MVNFGSILGRVHLQVSGNEYAELTIYIGLVSSNFCDTLV